MSGIAGSGKSTLKPAHTAVTRNKGDIKVLLAEDNLVNQKLAKLLFRKMGLSPTVVSTGKEAVEEATGHYYDIIFMDVHMPEMDGMEATQILKEKLGENCPNIIALTASSMNGDREKMLEAGMDEYLAKPITFKQLDECIQRYTSL